jgi:hypothetical protein
MGLKKLVKSRIQHGIVVPVLEAYLLSRGTVDYDRVTDTNSPSQCGGCLRSRYYSRTGERPDTLVTEPRTQRIFDNGDHVHLRLQEYLHNANILRIPELTVFNEEYEIFGHTDGLITLGTEAHELGVLEIKSINSNGFSQLYSAKPEHEKQALVYLYCLEKRRLYLRSNKNLPYKVYRASVEQLFQHLRDGKHYSRDEKIKHSADNMIAADDMLRECENPLVSAVLLYECKDTQELKEFVVSASTLRGAQIIDSLLHEFAGLNYAVHNKVTPNRPADGVSKSCNFCRWCNYRMICYN